jgi:hypothetical protein
MEEQQGFNPTFENGGFWEYYRDLERQFEDFLEYVPYLEGNKKTYSFKLLNIFLSIGGHIDSAFKELARYPRFAEIESCKDIVRRAEKKLGIIEDGIRAFDEIYAITSMTVTFKCLPNRISITPFNCEHCEHPEWWNSYNDLKHDLAVNLKKANLETVRDALAGAFLLNVIHEPAALRLFKYGLLKPNYAQGTTFWEPIFDTFRGKKLLDRPPDCKPVEDAFTIETSLFSFDYEEAKKLLEVKGKYRKYEPTETSEKG